MHYQEVRYARNINFVFETPYHLDTILFLLLKISTHKTFLGVKHLHLLLEPNEAQVKFRIEFREFADVLLSSSCR